MRPTDHRLRSLNLWAQINLFSIWVSFLVIVMKGYLIQTLNIWGCCCFIFWSILSNLPILWPLMIQINFCISITPIFGSIIYYCYLSWYWPVNTTLQTSPAHNLWVHASPLWSHPSSCQVQILISSICFSFTHPTNNYAVLTLCLSLF